MTVAVWRIATDTPDYTADGISGEGARRGGGRWNRRGQAAVYAVSNISLACMETIVHLAGGDLPLHRYLVRIEVPGDLWSTAAVLTPNDAPIGWDAVPAGKVSIDHGTDWLRSGCSLLLRVPSVIVPEEENVLINPAHPDIVRLVVAKVRKWLYDARVWG